MKNFRLFLKIILVLCSWALGEFDAEAKDKFKELLELGIKNSKSGDHKMAVNYFRQAIAINPKNGDGYFQLGYGLQQLRKYKESLGAYQSGLKLKPDYYYLAEAYYNMTVAADITGDGVSAIKYLKKSLQAYTDRLETRSVYKVGKYLKELSEKYPESNEK